MAVRKKPRSKEDEFTPRELIEYENLFKEPIGEIENDEKPRIEKIAYLGYLKCRRLDDSLTFNDYLDGLDSLEQASKDAFGDKKDDESE